MKVDVNQLDAYLALVEARWNTSTHCADKSYREGFRDAVALVRTGLKSPEVMATVGVAVEAP